MMVAVTRLHVSIATFGLVRKCLGWPWEPAWVGLSFRLCLSVFEQRGLLQSLLHWGLTLSQVGDCGSPVSAFMAVLVKVFLLN